MGEPVLVKNSFLQDVAEGRVPGYSIERKFGAIDAIQTATPADVWEYGITPGAEIYTFSADGVADIDSMSSSNVGDTEDMTIVGLDINGLEVTQTIALTGQTRVPLTTNLWRVNRVFNSNGTNLLGNIYVYVNGAITGGVPNVVTTVRGYVSIGEGQTLQTIYTVPAGKTAYLYGIRPSLTKGVGATPVGAILTGKTREFGKVFRTQDKFNLSSAGTSAFPELFPFPLPFSGKSDFCPQADVSTNGVGVSWTLYIVLKDN